jgi:hypothetical protein
VFSFRRFPTERVEERTGSSQPGLRPEPKNIHILFIEFSLSLREGELADEKLVQRAKLLIVSSAEKYRLNIDRSLKPGP